MNLAIKYLLSDEDPIEKSPSNLLCCKCDLLVTKGTPMRRYGPADFYHEVCPDLPWKNHSTSKRNATSTFTYPYKLYLEA